LKKLDRNMKN